MVNEQTDNRVKKRAPKRWPKIGHGESFHNAPHKPKKEAVDNERKQTQCEDIDRKRE